MGAREQEGAGAREHGSTGAREKAGTLMPPRPHAPTLPRSAVWLAAARPKTLPAAAAPVLLGTAFAWGLGGFHAGAALCALAGALLIQIGTNFVNDSEDAVRGADTPTRVGPVRAVAAGLVTAGQMRRAAALTFALAVAAGGFLIARGGWPVLALGLVSIAMGVAYTAGRYALAYTGLADLAVLVFFGPVAVGGTVYVQALALPPWVLLAGLGPGALATAILVANNVRDAEGDRAAGKRTLVARFGVPFGLRVYSACVSIAVAVPAGIVFTTRADVGMLAASVVATLGGRRLASRLAASVAAPVPAGVSHPANAVLAQTGRLLLAYCLAFAAGYLLT